MLYISTSNGVFAYDSETEKVESVLGNRTGHGWKGVLGLQRSFGCFGIALDRSQNEILIAARARLGTPAVGKPSTDAWIFSLTARSHRVRKLAALRDIHDVHQIALWRSYVLLSDTGKNRVHFFDRETQVMAYVVNVGAQRTDVNHINALTVVDDRLYVGCNNRGERKGEVISFDLRELANARATHLSIDDLDAEIRASAFPSTHDIEPYGAGEFLICASHAGKVFKMTDGTELVHAPGEWVRGLAVSSEGIWLGSSVLADRAHRHDKHLSGHVALYDQHTGERKRIVPISGAGQVNDLLLV